MEQFLAAKEQISICGSVINEWVAEQILAQRDAFLTPTLAEWRRRLDRVAEWIAGEPMREWVRPAGGVVAFPDRKSVVWGKGVSVRVDLGVCGFFQKKKENKN